MTATPQPEVGQDVGGVRRYREYGVLYDNAMNQWCLIHQRLDAVWHILATFPTRDEAQAMFDRMYAPPPRKRAARRETPQLAGQLDIYGNEVHE